MYTVINICIFREEIIEFCAVKLQKNRTYFEQLCKINAFSLRQGNVASFQKQK